MNQQQTNYVREQLRAGWFWNVVIYVKRTEGCSFGKAFKIVEELA